MSTFSITCKVSLSKKLRALLKGGTITLTSNIEDGKGNGQLLLTSNDMVENIDIKEIGETSIMLTPLEIIDEVPNNGTRMVSNIFASVPNKKTQKNEPVVQKMATVNPPEDGERITVENVRLPETFGELNDPECRDYVNNLTELVNAVNAAKHKKADAVDITKITNPRVKAVEMEKMELAEAIDVPAWIVLNGDAAGSIAINDLDIRLKQNIPFNLNRISAKRIASSNDLQDLLKAGFIKFIAPSEVKGYAEKIISDIDPSHSTLEVYSNHDDAMDAIGDVNSHLQINESTAIDITEKDISAPSEEEAMIINLTENMPTVKSQTVSSVNGIKKSVHGNIISSQAPQSPQNAKTPSVKPVKSVTSR